MENKTYKRETREVPEEVRQKISAALKNRKKTPEHCQHISNSLKADTGGYWSKIPPKRNKEQSSTTIEDIML